MLSSVSCSPISCCQAASVMPKGRIQPRGPGLVCEFWLLLVVPAAPAVESAWTALNLSLNMNCQALSRRPMPKTECVLRKFWTSRFERVDESGVCSMSRLPTKPGILIQALLTGCDSQVSKVNVIYDHVLMDSRPASHRPARNANPYETRCLWQLVAAGNHPGFLLGLRMPVDYLWTGDLFAPVAKGVRKKRQHQAPDLGEASIGAAASARADQSKRRALASIDINTKRAVPAHRDLTDNARATLSSPPHSLPTPPPSQLHSPPLNEWR